MKKFFQSYGFLISVLFLFFVTTVCFFECIYFDLIWDDVDLHIVANPYFQEISLHNIIRFWLRPFKGLYIPVTYTLWSGIQYVGRMIFPLQTASAVVFHAVNLIFHLLNGALVLYLFHKSLKFRLLASLLGALFFLLHPLQVETVCWVSEFRGLSAAFFGFLSIIFYLKAMDLLFENHTDSQDREPELRFYARRTCKNNAIVFASGRDIKERGDSSASSRLCRFHSPSSCKSMDPKLRSGMSPGEHRSSIFIFFYLASFISFVFALLSKPSAVVIPPILFCLHLFNRLSDFSLVLSKDSKDVSEEDSTSSAGNRTADDERVGRYFERLLLLKKLIPIRYRLTFELYLQKVKQFEFFLKISFFTLLPWCVVDIILALITSVINIRGIELHPLSLVQRFLIAGDSLNFYIRKVIFPYPLLPCYSRTPNVVLSHWWIYWEWIIPFMLILLCLFLIRHYYLLYGFVIFLIGLIPVSGILPFAFQKWSTVADRYTYIPMLGVAFILTEYLNLRPKRQKISYILVIFLLTVYLLYDKFLQIPVWKNSISVFGYCIRYNKHDYKTFFNRGLGYYKKKQYALAVKDYKHALKLNPYDPQVYNYLGMAVWKNEDSPGNAIKLFSQAIKLSPKYSKAYHNRANAYVAMKKYDKAFADYKNALSIAPESGLLYSDMGNYYTEINKFEKALECFDKALRLNPYDTSAWYNKGLLLSKMKKFRQAIYCYNMGLKYTPDYAKAYFNRAIVYTYLKKYDRAIQDNTYAIKINPFYAEAYNNRGLLYYKKTQYAKALNDFSKAIFLKKNFPDVYFNRGNLWVKLKRFDKALDDYNKALKVKPDYKEALFNLNILKKLLKIKKR